MRRTTTVMMRCVLVLSCLLAAPPAPAEGPRLTLDGAIGVALTDNPLVKASRMGVEAAKATRWSGKARYFPVLQLSANLIVWDSELELSFAGGDSGGGSMDPSLLPPPDPTKPYELAVWGIVDALSGLSKPMTVRDQVTGEVGVRIVQPITPLFTISYGWEALDQVVTMAEASSDRVRAEVSEQVAVLYLRLLQALAMADSERLAVAELEAQLGRVEALIEAGVASEVDRLRLEVGVAARKQQVIQAQTSVAMARSALAATMGRSVDEIIEPTPIDGWEVPTLELTPDEASARALDGRPDLAQLRAGIRQAEMGEALAKAEMAPMLLAVASYTHSEGSSFAEEDAFFGGLMLDWNVFEWGATWKKIERSEAQRKQLEYQGEALRAGVLLEVKSTRLQYEGAVEGLDVATRAVAPAEEAVRLETRRFEAGESTTTDLLGAETALATARNYRIAAYYECLVAFARYRKAMGAPLSFDSLTPGGSHAQL